MERGWTREVVRHACLLVVMLAAVGGAVPARGQSVPYSDLYLPLLVVGVDRQALATPATVEPRPTATAGEASATATGSASPTEPGTTEPTVTRTATPTPTHGATGLIHGRITVGGEPMADGYGLPGFPQIELRVRSAGEWLTVANAVTQNGGQFEFRDPPPLAGGDVYQVWWVNEDTETSLGLYTFLGRWWSRLIPVFGSGEDIDVGTFELENLEYTGPGDDIHYSLPSTFKWRVRDNEAENYQWRLHKRCGKTEDQYNAYSTEFLGHVGEYTVEAPPRGFLMDVTYCWFVFISDEQNGTGWPYFTWRTRFLSVFGNRLALDLP